MPADSSQVSRRDTNEFSSALNVLKELKNSGANLRADLFVVRFNFPAYSRKSLGEKGFESVVVDAFAGERGSQNREIGHAMVRHPLDGSVDAIGFEHRLMQRVPVHEIFCDEEGTIDVEHIRVSQGKG